MSDAAYTARPTNKAMALERIGKLQFNKDTTGQYQHDDIVKLFENIERELGGMFNLLDRQHGMAKLMQDHRNAINIIKSTSKKGRGRSGSGEKARRRTTT